MGLRLRLNLLLSLMFVATLGIGSAILVNVFRDGVAEELTASVEQAAELVTIVVSRLPADITDRQLERALKEIVNIGSTRHLRISTDPSANAPFNAEQLLAPRWFFDLLAPEPVGLIRVIDLRSKRRQVVIRADATAEINEAWREAVPLFLTLILFGLLANGLIYVMVGRSLSSLQKVGDAIQEISSGDYASELPAVGVSDIDRISARVNALAAELRRSQSETQALTRRSLTIQEQERRDLSQALHDELGQSINAIKALGVSIKQRSAESSEIGSSVQSIIDISSEMHSAVRDLMSVLRPSVLDELGLRLALENMVDDWNSHHEEVFCTLRFAQNLTNFDENLSINIFRIIQEALNNVVKHARAKEVNISLTLASELSSPQLSLVIYDDGIGFNTQAVSKGLGFRGIEERVEALGGKLQLDSGQNGTEYRILIPEPKDATHPETRD